jgi:hypothetical protein
MVWSVRMYWFRTSRLYRFTLVRLTGLEWGGFTGFWLVRVFLVWNEEALQVFDRLGFTGLEWGGFTGLHWLGLTGLEWGGFTGFDRLGFTGLEWGGFTGFDRLVFTGLEWGGFTGFRSVRIYWFGMRRLYRFTLVRIDWFGMRRLYRFWLVRIYWLRMRRLYRFWLVRIYWFGSDRVRYPSSVIVVILARFCRLENRVDVFIQSGADSSKPKAAMNRSTSCYNACKNAFTWKYFWGPSLYFPVNHIRNQCFGN